MTDLKETQKRIDIKIAELRQQAHFARNKYDYHHKNDELQIIQRQMDILDQVAGTYSGFLNEMQKFNQTLHAAKLLSSQLGQLLQSQPTTQSERQHETKPPSSSTKDKSKDATSSSSKKQLFPPT